MNGCLTLFLTFRCPSEASKPSLGSTQFYSHAEDRFVVSVLCDERMTWINLLCHGVEDGHPQVHNWYCFP